jgi:hypothetical protein
MRMNQDALVQISVMGRVATPGFPSVPAAPYLITAEGKPEVLPSFGSIVYNVKMGDPAFGWAGDRIQPGVSIAADDAVNKALNIFACLGNEATVMSGSASGARGIVVGKSGRFAEHVIVHFSDEVLEGLNLGDKVQVRAWGRGLKVEGHEDVVLKSLAPNLLEAIGARETDDGKLEVPVVKRVPGLLIGPGAGLTSEGGALNIQASDQDMIKEHRLNELRLGDLVAVEDLDSRYFHGYRRGALGIGVICQTDSPVLGHGPGMALVMTSNSGGIVTRIDKATNLVNLIDLP